VVLRKTFRKEYAMRWLRRLFETVIGFVRDLTAVTHVEL
jgi:hypothetical protein